MRKINIKKIMMVSFLICALFFCFYTIILCFKYPKHKIDTEQLYGPDNMNLKDFEVSGEGLVSTTGDPWIEFSLDKEENLKIIEVQYSGLEDTEVWGCIWNTDTWDVNYYQLKNGKNFILFDKTITESKVQHLRFDLVEQKDVYFQLDGIILNSRQGIIWLVIKKWLKFIWLLIMLACLLLVMLNNSHVVPWRGIGETENCVIVREKLIYTEKMLEHYKLFVYALAFVLIFFGINNITEYAADTYNTFYRDDSWRWMLYGNGRAFNALIYYIIEALEIPNEIIYKISYWFAFAFLTAAVYVYAKLLLEFIDNCLLSVALSFLIIANIFSIEYFLFIEKGLFMLGILLCTIAAAFTIKFIITPNCSKFYILYAFVCLFISVFIYQAILGLYVVLCLPFLAKYASNIRRFLLQNLLVAFLYSVPLLVGYVITKFCLQSIRVGAPKNIFQNILSVFLEIYKIITQKWYYIPSKMLFVFLLTICVVACIFIFVKRQHIIFSIFAFLYVMAGTLFTAFIMHFTGISEEFKPRNIYPFGCLFGILLVWLLLEYYNSSHNSICIISTCIIVCFLGLQYLSFNSVFVERYQTIEADRYWCEIIRNKIQEYEMERNVTIDTICFYKDKSISWQDLGLQNTGMSIAAKAASWSDCESLNFYLNKNYKEGEALPEYEEYFSNFNWDTYSEKQLIFEGSTLHLCVY